MERGEFLPEFSQNQPKIMFFQGFLEMNYPYLMPIVREKQNGELPLLLTDLKEIGGSKASSMAHPSLFKSFFWKLCKDHDNVTHKTLFSKVSKILAEFSTVSFNFENFLIYVLPKFN